MAKRCAGQVVWITGGGSGLGAALACAFADAGATVAVSGRRRDKLDQVVSDIAAKGGTAIAVPCDVTVDTQVQAAVDTVVDRCGRLDVAVANAGYAALGAVADTPLDVWRRQLDVNVLGAVSTARHALPELQRTGGRLGLVGSVAAFLPVPRQGPYVVSKAAVDALGRTLATECAGTGVSVTTLHPGFVRSEIVQRDAHGRWVGGRKDPRPSFLLWDPDDAARVMRDALLARQRTVVFTGHGKLAAALGRHAPDLVHRAVTAASTPIVPAPRPRDLGPLPRTPQPDVTMARDLTTGPLLIRAARRAAVRAQGVLPPDGTFPDLTARRTGVVVPADQVAAYRTVCRAPGPDDVLPLAMPEILFLGLMGRIVTDASFPLSPLGLIHVGQVVEGAEPVPAGTPLDLAAHLAEARRTDKGFEVDLHLTVHRDGRPVWRAVTTLLSRAPGVRGGRRTRGATVPDDAVVHQAPEDLGRAYARVSGDHNPHHLWAFTARPLGYRRPIAHGMWSLAALLGELPGDVVTGRAEVAFKRPLELPGTFASRVAADDDAWRLDAWAPETGAPLVLGTWTPA